jgi:hypothetical protein
MCRREEKRRVVRLKYVEITLSSIVVSLLGDSRARIERKN